MSRLFPAAVATVILGVEVATLSLSFWLSVAGVVLATVGVAVVLTATGYRGMAGEAGRRLLFAAVLFASTAPVAVILWLHHPAVEVAMRQVVLRPGASLTVSDISSPQSQRADSGEGQPLVDGSFGVLEVADIPPATSHHVDARTTVFHIRLHVESSDCARLEAKLEGGCAKVGTPLRDFDSFEVLTPRRTQPLTAVIRPREARAVELAETSESVQQGVPTEWNLAHDGPRTDVDLYCLDGAPLEVRTPFAHAHAHCDLAGEIYLLSVEASAGPDATLFLSELSELRAHVAGGAANAVVENAALSIEGNPEDLPNSPGKVSLTAGEGEDVELRLKQSLASNVNDVSFFSAGASSVKAGDRERVPNWFAQHSDLAYFLAGILFATLLPALFDFLLTRLK
jgi:hypothetical protein